jgi:hypothetical protein
MANTVKTLPVEVYRDHLGDCTNGGVSSRHNTLYLACDRGFLDSDPADPASLIPQITEESFKALVADGTIAGGMIPKLENAFAAIRAGVAAVRITHISDLQGGTVIVGN